MCLSVCLLVCSCYPPPSFNSINSIGCFPLFVVQRVRMVVCLLCPRVYTRYYYGRDEYDLGVCIHQCTLAMAERIKLLHGSEYSVGC